MPDEVDDGFAILLREPREENNDDIEKCLFAVGIACVLVEIDTDCLLFDWEIDAREDESTEESLLMNIVEVDAELEFALACNISESELERTCLAALVSC